MQWRNRATRVTAYFGDTRLVNDVVLRCLFVFAWFVSKTWKFHIPRVGMEYSNAQITASTLAQVHSEKSNRVVGDVCRHARNCNIPRGVPSSPWGVAWRQSALSSDARPQRMWKAQEMDLVPIVKTLIRALVNHGCW